jgi:hypothetical protein
MLRHEEQETLAYVGWHLNGVFLKLCGARLDWLTGRRYSRACEQNQIGPLGQVCEL